MSSWVCCNSCFSSPSGDRKLAVTSCGHVICNICYQKGKQGKCLICSAKCQVSPLSDSSTPEVKDMFSDISAVAAKYMEEIGKVIIFQGRHQKRLLTHYKQRSEKQEEVMQQMTKKMNEQSAYIAKLENAVQRQSVKVSPVTQISYSSHTPRGHKPVPQVPHNTPISLSGHSSATNISENMEVDERSLFKKPNCVPRRSFITAQDGRMGSIAHRSSNQNTSTMHSVQSATVSRSQGAPLTMDVSHSQSSGWKTPIRLPSPCRHSMF